MMRWRITVSKNDGTTETYEIGATQIVHFEQKWKKGLAKAFTADPRMEELFWLAWEAERSNGVTVPVFGDAYFDTLLNVEVEPVENPHAGTR